MNTEIFRDKRSVMERPHLSLLAVMFSILCGWPMLVSAQGKTEQRTNPIERTAESIKRGEAVFFEYCSGCHGRRADGRGPQALNLVPKPQNLRNAAFTRSLSDERLFSSISGGVRGTSMPAFEMLYSAERRWDVINYVRSLTEDYALRIQNAPLAEKVPAEYPNPVPADERSVASGQKLFQEYCASCHGSKADGKGAVAASLTPRPRNLVVVTSWGESPFMNYLSDSRVYDSITNGVPGTSMSPWIQVTSAQERWHIINFLREEAKKGYTAYDQP
jgi:mono/diheme cytochrome c family protein